MDVKGSRIAHAPTPRLHRWHVRIRRRGRHTARVQAKQKKQKQQYGSGVGGAANLDPALEAAYQQFGRALGEAPRETARVVQQKLGLEQDTQTLNISQAGSVQQQRAQQKQVDEAGFKKLERLFDIAMSDPLNDREAQPQALLRAKSRMAPSITEAQRRETLLELMENTLKPRKAAADLGMDLIQPARPSTGQQVPKLAIPNGKRAAAVRPGSSLEASADATPALIMPRSKQASPVRPQSLGAGSREPVAEPAPAKANLGPPPPLMQPKGRLEVQQATRLANELDAMQRELPTARAPVVEEPKPKPAPQPVPQLSRAPARPAPPVTEAAQLPGAAAPSDAAPSMKSSDKLLSRSTKPFASRPASESTPPQVVRKAPRHPAGQAAETSQAASSAAKAEETSPGASDSAVQPKPLPQLRQAPLRPSTQATDAGNAATDASPAAEQSAARVQDPAANIASLPPAPLPKTVPEISPVPDGQASQASSQGAIAAGDDLAEPDQAATASPRVAPAPLPPPQRPNKPRALATPPAVRPSSAASQGVEGSGSASDTSSAAAVDRSEAAPPAAGAADASPDALPQAPELLIPSQPESPLAPSAATGDNKEGALSSRAAPGQQEGGAGISLQPPAPPMALPKPALPAAQPDQTTGSDPGGLHPRLQEQWQVAQRARASLEKLPGKAIEASYGGVIVKADAGIRGFLPFAQMLPERQKQIRQSFDAQGLPEDLDVPELRGAFAKSIRAVVRSQRVEVYVLTCKVAERPDYNQPGRTKTFIKNVFSEIAPQFDMPQIGLTKPPSPAAIRILQSYLGQVINGAVAHVADEYAILHFQVVLDDGKMERVPGLLHSEQADITDLWVGQVIEAVLESVLTDTRGLKLSGRGIRPPLQRSDLQQTLEDVVSDQSTAKEKMGTLPAVELLCQALAEQEDVLETIPGRRLQGNAFAPEIQVFLSKSEPDAGAESGDGDGTAQRFTLLVRTGNEVQEVEVLASLSREAMKSAVSAALSGVIQYTT